MGQLICPEKLSHRDKVIIVSPSGAIEPEFIRGVTFVLQHWGLSVEIAPHASSRVGRFCGSVEERLSDLQQAMDEPEAKAILCSRGGYGVVHLFEKLDFTHIKQHPKWLIGYSDITALHVLFQKNGLMSFHAPMAKHLVQDMDTSASYYLKEALFGAPFRYEVAPHPLNRSGKANGQLVGGNLAVFCGLIGTAYLDIPPQAVLFLEDIGEQPYKIDRMMWQLKLAGVFEQISGLVVGRFTDYEEDPLMYATVYESIRHIVADYEFPVCFGFPVGHIVANYPLAHGAKAALEITTSKVSLAQPRQGAFL